MYEPVFQIVNVTKDFLSTETAIQIGEHITHQISIAPFEDNSEEAVVKLIGKHKVRNGVLALPVGEVLILRLYMQGLASPSLYLAVDKPNVEKIEKAILGLIQDFKIVTLFTELAYVNEEDKVCANVTNTISCSSERVMAVWLDMSAYMQELQDAPNINFVTEPVLKSED